MKKTLSCLNEYIEIINHDNFIAHWKELSRKIIHGIRLGYSKKDSEPKIVENVKNIIDSINTFNTSSNKFSVSTNSIFVHGATSFVEFEYYGKHTVRELADIIFILTLTCNNELIFEKMTINQVKKSTTKASWNFNSDSHKEQLYLLSRFPVFKGSKRSLIPRKEYNLHSLTGCLGSYGLLYPPGDFAVISSNLLSVVLSNKNTLKLGNLAKFINKNNSKFYCLDYREYNYIAKYLYLMTILKSLFSEYLRFILSDYPIPILNNNCVSCNAFEFSKNYLQGLVGDLIYSKDFHYNIQAKEFLQDFLNSVELKARKENNNKILNFVKEYKNLHINNKNKINKIEKSIEFNSESRGVGIVHSILKINYD